MEGWVELPAPVPQRAGGRPLTMPGKHQHFQEPEVGCCGKYFLFGFNIVFWVSAGLGSGPCPADCGTGGSVPYWGETTPPTRGWDRTPTPSSHSGLHAHLQDHLREVWSGAGGRVGEGSLLVSPQSQVEKGEVFP